MITDNENALNLQDCVNNNGLLIIDGNAYTADTNGGPPFAFYSGPVLSSGEPSFDENDWGEIDFHSMDLKTKEKLMALLWCKNSRSRKRAPLIQLWVKSKKQK